MKSTIMENQFFHWILKQNTLPLVKFKCKTYSVAPTSSLLDTDPNAGKINHKDIEQLLNENSETGNKIQECFENLEKLGHDNWNLLRLLMNVKLRNGLNQASQIYGNRST